MRRMGLVVQICVALVLLLSTALGESLTEKEEARLHPTFRMLLKEAFDGNGLMRSSGPELTSERGAIIHTSDIPALRAAGIKLQSVYDGFVTARVGPPDVLRLAKMDGVRYVDPGEERYTQMDVSFGETGAPLLHSGFINNTPYKGEGAIVLVYDSGIDWKHLDFRDPNDTTKSRILAIWDQTLTPLAGESSPAGFTYGVVYTKSHIEDEIDGSPTGYVREVDVNGHGTHVAGTAVGNGGALGGKYTGIAPRADIIVVKGGDGTFNETRIIDGLTYAQQQAASFGKPVVVNMSLGGQVGPHDGTMADEVAVDVFASVPGQVAVIAAGNDAGARIHRGGFIGPGEDNVLQVVVPSYTPAAGTENDRFYVDIWLTGNPNVTVQAVSPTGISFTRNVNQLGTAPDESDGTIDVYNTTSSLNAHRRLQVIVHDRTAATPRVGTWQIVITNNTMTSLSFDAWLGSKTLGDRVATLDGGDDDKTVGMPGTANRAITVGSYMTKFSWPSIDGNQYDLVGDDRVGNYSLFSCLGPTADGRQKPEIAAPGQSIASSLSRSVDMTGKRWAIAPGGRHQMASGTSMATPHVAGAAALLLAVNPGLTADQIKALLVSTSDGDVFATGLPNATWGHGKLDIVEAVARLLNGNATVTRSIVSYDQPGAGFFWRLTGSARYAVRFSSPISGHLTAVQVNVYHQNVRPIAGDGSLLCELYSDGGGSPGARIGNAVQVPFSSLSPGTNNHIQLTSANAGITAGTDYFIVLSLTQPGDTIAVLSDGESNGHRSLSFNGVKWEAVSQNFRFRPVVVSTSGVTTVQGEPGLPQVFELRQNYPNPFNPSTRITYAIPERAHVSLKIFDVLGKEVAQIIDGEQAAGSHQVTWSGTSTAGYPVSSGVYFYRLESNGLTSTKRMMLVK